MGKSDAHPEEPGGTGLRDREIDRLRLTQGRHDGLLLNPGAIERLKTGRTYILNPNTKLAPKPSLVEEYGLR